MTHSELQEKIFQISSDEEFEQVALATFRYQYDHCAPYRRWVDLLHIHPDSVRHSSDIPALPIEMFKRQHIVSFAEQPTGYFQSSGTTSMEHSHHYYRTLALYDRSLTQGFRSFWGDPAQYRIVALLPNYIQQQHSSLIHMMEVLIGQTRDTLSGLHEHLTQSLVDLMVSTTRSDRRLMLFGVTYALLDLASDYAPDLQGAIVFETGGMKGRRKEMVKAELHSVLKAELHATAIASEYGMCELFSQAYSHADGQFHTPSWMRVLVRDLNAPQCPVPLGRTGGINIIDLANLDSCAFIATQDLGRRLPTEQPLDTPFELLGRIDHSDLRGCNLMAEGQAFPQR